MPVGVMPVVLSVGFALILLCAVSASSAFSLRARWLSTAEYIALGVYLCALFCCIVVYREHRDAVIAASVMAGLCALTLLLSLLSVRRRLRAEQERKRAELERCRDVLRQLIGERVSMECSLQEYAARLIDGGTPAQERELLGMLDLPGGASPVGMIVAIKRRLARQRGIAFDVALSGRIPDDDPVETVSLIGNLLDNAIEAAGASGAAEPFVRGSISFAAGVLGIELSNSKSQAVTMHRNDYRLGKPKKGIGTNQIASAVAAHNGTVRVRDSGDELRLDIRLHPAGAGAEKDKKERPVAGRRAVI